MTGEGTFLGSIHQQQRKDFCRWRGIEVTAVTVFGAGPIAGGITNAGTISALHACVNLTGVGTFLGSIVNSSAEKIIAGHAGIYFSTVAVFGAGTSPAE